MSEDTRTDFYRVAQSLIELVNAHPEISEADKQFLDVAIGTLLDLDDAATGRAE